MVPATSIFTKKWVQLTIHGQCAAALVLPKLILNQYGVLSTVLGCASGDHHRADTTAGIVPEFRIGGDVDVTLVQGNHRAGVPQESTGHVTVLSSAHCMVLEWGDEVGGMAPVSLFIFLYVGTEGLCWRNKMVNTSPKSVQSKEYTQPLWNSGWSAEL